MLDKVKAFILQNDTNLLVGVNEILKEHESSSRTDLPLKIKQT